MGAKPRARTVMTPEGIVNTARQSWRALLQDLAHDDAVRLVIHNDQDPDEMEPEEQWLASRIEMAAEILGYPVQRERGRRAFLEEVLL